MDSVGVFTPLQNPKYTRRFERMNIVVYAGLAYLLTASISLLVVGMIVGLNKILEKTKERG